MWQTPLPVVGGIPVTWGCACAPDSAGSHPSTHYQSPQSHQTVTSTVMPASNLHKTTHNFTSTAILLFCRSAYISSHTFYHHTSHSITVMTLVHIWEFISLYLGLIISYPEVCHGSPQVSHVNTVTVLWNEL